MCTLRKFIFLTKVHISTKNHAFKFQEQTKFAKKCRKEGGFFKCCVWALHLAIFEFSRNKLIGEGLIKDEPTHLCKPGLDRKDPCVTCNADAMCTKMDVKTGQKKHTFIKDYKKEHRVTRWHVYLFMCLYRLGERIKPLTRDLA